VAEKPIVATFRARQQANPAGGGLRDGGLADARLQLADVDEAFHAGEVDVEVDCDGVDNDPLAQARPSRNASGFFLSDPRAGLGKEQGIPFFLHVKRQSGSSKF
jgi:hypothetical protein